MKNTFWLLFFICAVINVKSLYSQSTTLVTYSLKVFYNHPNSITFNPQKIEVTSLYVGQLIMNDTMSYYHISDFKVNPFKKLEQLPPSNLPHHKVITTYDVDGVYQMRYWPEVKVENLVIDTFPKYSWVVDSADKYFLNYKCREAYAVVAPTDTMFVLFAVDIPLPFGPGYFIGAPGLVLEGFYAKSHQYVIAKKIEKVHYEMRLPHNKN